MEDAIKEQQQPATGVSAGILGKSKLRYPLRSATKTKEEKPPVESELSNSSASKRGRSASSVSKSVGVLDLSSKEKSAKPPRRLSIPAKSGFNSGTKLVGYITPISEARTKRSNGQGRSETPLSDVSRTSTRKKFVIGSSASYWLTQIKLFESSAKHNISLGLFKLALEAGCEPLQKMRNEFRSYVTRHKLGEGGELVKELFESYNISDNQEHVQVSQTCSQMPDEATRSSDDEVLSSCTMGTRKLRPRSLNADTAQVSTVTESSTKGTTHQKNMTATKTRATSNKSTVNSRSALDTGRCKLEKKQSQKPTKQEATKGKGNIKKQGKKSDSDSEEDAVSPSSAVTPGENKENMDAPAVQEISV